MFGHADVETARRAFLAGGIVIVVAVGGSRLGFTPEYSSRFANPLVR